MFDQAKMIALAQREFLDRIVAHYGDVGGELLPRLLEAIHEVHHWLAYEVVSDLIVFSPLDVAGAHVLGTEYIEIPAPQLPQFFSGAGAVMALPDGRFRLWSDVPDVHALAAAAVVYRFNGADTFVVGADAVPVFNPTGFPSVFGLPTFVDLKRAFDHYSSSMARYSTCKILSRCWYGGRRIILVNQPEKFMRRSLAQYLRSTLRDHEAVEVREEQIVDDSHPVDIKVTWALPHRLALIEIKWLGNCVNEAGTALSGTEYRGARAREGAQQLRDYLENNKPDAPTHVTVGYLVVFDARRRNVVNLASEGALSATDARHYRTKPIQYDPQWHLERRDFAEPERIYLEPKV